MTQEDAVDPVLAAACATNSIPEERVRLMFEVACKIKWSRCWVHNHSSGRKSI